LGQQANPLNTNPIVSMVIMVNFKNFLRDLLITLIILSLVDFSDLGWYSYILMVALSVNIILSIVLWVKKRPAARGEAGNE
jgi:hypothetical protein